MTPITRKAQSWQLSDVHHVYFRFTGNPCVAGESFITNGSGMFFLYVGDDPRQEPSNGIIATGQMGGDLHWLPNECKQEIEIMTRYTKRRGKEETHEN